MEPSHDHGFVDETDADDEDMGGGGTTGEEGVQAERMLKDNPRASSDSLFME